MWFWCQITNVKNRWTYKLFNKHDGKQTLTLIICILYVIDTRSYSDITMGGDEIFLAL